MSSDVLISLRNSCDQLDSDKVTERKKHIEYFKRELNRQLVQNQLDRNTDNGRGFTWDDVFRVVQHYMLKEVEYLKKNKGASSTSVSTRDRKKQEVGTVFKWFVRKANQRGESLKCSDVVQHILLLMKDEFTASAFGVDCCSVLLKDVLRSRKYYCELPQKSWHELLMQFCKFLYDPVTGLSHDLLSRVMRSILAGAVVQSSVHKSVLFNFFSGMVNKLRSEKSVTVVENVLAALNTFSATVAGDSRTQLCKLGEDTLGTCMHVWRHNPTATIKEEVISFLGLQMKLHHPHGVLTEEKGAYAADMKVWRSHLQQLYELIHEEWRQPGTRMKLKGIGSREIVFRSALVDFAADVCHQIFSGNYLSVEVTPMMPHSSQSSSSSGHVTQGGVGAKRLKVESGWTLLRETVAMHAQSAVIVPWLQLLRALLHKYPASVPMDQLLLLLSTLHQIQSDSKRAEVQTWILQTMQALVVCQHQQRNLPTGLSTALHSEWTKVWSCAIRTISLHTAESDGFDLLTCLLHHGIVSPDREHWRLFMTDSPHPTRNSVQFLATFLHNNALPENHICRGGGIVVSSSAVKGNYPLRHQLLNWLLLTEEQEEPGERLQLVKLLKSLPTTLVVEVLGVLTQRTTQSRQSIATLTPSSTTLKTDQTLQDVETLYLRSSFDLSDDNLSKIKNDNGGITAVASSSVVSCMKLNLMQGLERVGLEVLEFSSSEIEYVEALVHYASLLCKTLAVLLEFSVLSAQEIAQSKLAESLKTLLKRVTTAIRNLWHKSDSTTDKTSRVQSLIALIIALDGMFTWDWCVTSQEAQRSATWLADTCQSITSKELLDTLMEIVQKKGSSISLTRCSTSKRAAVDPFGDDAMDTNFDDEFDGDDKDDFDMNSNLTEETAAQKGCQSLLSLDVLSDSELLALRTVHLLCSWCLTGEASQHRDRMTTVHSGHRAGHSGFTAIDIQEKLLELMDEQVFDPHAAFHVQLFYTIAESFIEAKDQLSDWMLVGLLHALRMIASIHRKDQELCRAILSLLSRLIPFLQCNTSVVSTDLEQARDSSLRLVAAFWKLQCDGEYTAPVRLAIAKCMHAFILIDPTGKWTLLRSKVKEKGQGDNCRTVSGEFGSLLKDGCHSVRMYVASAIKCQFCCDATPFTKEMQNQSFDAVYQMAQDAMDIKEGLSGTEQAEEVVYRTASLLTTLSTVACYSPACEKKTVFALMQTIHLNGIEVSLMMKVLQSISDTLHYTSVIAFIESHLGYLIHQWLLEEYKLTQFPYQLLACSTEVDFYRKYHQVVLPHLVTLQCLDTVRDIAQTLDTDWIGLLKESFPQSIAQILPLFCHSRATEEEVDSVDFQEKRALAVLCFGALEKTLGKEMIDSMIQGHLDSIVVELLSMLYETSSGDSHLVQFTSGTDPEPNPPFFNSYSIKATLDYLTNCHAGSRTLTLVSLLAKTQDNIQKILLALHIRISKSHRSHEKLRMVLAYHLFTRLLLDELSSGLGGSWAMVLQDVIYTLVHTIHEGEETGEGEGLRLARPCVSLLHDVCVAGLQHCHEELGKHLNVLMGGLVPLVAKKDQVSKQALSLINMLVIDNSDKLSTALQYLDPLPDYPSLANAKESQIACKCAGGEFTLMEEVNNFLMVGNQQGGILRLEGIRHLHQQLANRKEELSVMVQQCAEGSDRTIIQLVTELVELSSTKDYQMNSTGDMAQALKEEAGRCLGDIGAPNLSTVALHCDEMEKHANYTTALKVFATDTLMCRHVIIIHLLKEYLTDQNVDTVEAAANCLKTVMATTSGQRCYEKYKDKNIDKLFYYLHPFIRQSKKKVTSKPVIQYADASFAQTIGDPSLWQLSDGNHSNWVRNLTVALIQSGGVKDEMLLMLQPICQVKVEFAEKVLPYLFHDILSTGNDVHRQVLSQCIEAVFTKHCGTNNNSRAATPVSFMDVNSTNQLGQRSIRTLLDVIHYLRTQDRPTQSRSKSTAWDNNFWLDVNYLLVAKAAQNCRAHFTCLLYTEIWCDVQRSHQGSSASRGSGSESLSQPSDIETLSALSNESNIDMQSLLLEAYSSIGEPDSVYGCGAGRLTHTYARIHTYEHEGEWSKAVCAYDLKLHSKSNQTGQEELGVLQAMQNQGLSHILTVYLQGLKSEDVAFGHEMTQFQYEAAWRNANWDLEVDDRDQTTSPGFHQSVYTALSCLRDGECESFTMALKQARLDTIEQLCHVSIQSAYSVYPMLSRLQGLVEMEQFGSMLLSTKDPSSILHCWTSQLTLMDNDFKFAEPTLALRTVLLQLFLEKSNETNHTQAFEGLVKHLKCQIEMARKAQSFQIAEKSLATLQSLERPAELQTDHSWWRLIEEAKVYWSRNEETTAMHLMKALLDKISQIHTTDPVADAIHPEVLNIYGNWLAETNSDSPNVIIEQYMEKAVDIYNARCDTTAPAIEAYLSLARFADTQYQNIVNYMKSSEYEAKASLMKQAKKAHEELLAFGDKTSRYARTLLKQSEIDENELESKVQDKENYLQKALECYLKCLECGTIEHNMRAFRVCSLWFDNSSDNFLNELIQNSFEHIESHKFLPLLYQLAARMTTKTQDKQLFHQVLNQLIEKMALDHPHHALPIILALANANKDAVITSRRTGRLARTVSMRDVDTSHADEARMQAAQDMLARLRLIPKCCPIIAGLEKLSEAYIELAYWDVTDRKKETGPILLPQNQPLTQLKHLQHVAMPTMEVPVDSTCRYDNIVWVEGFDGYFKLAGGVNLPKIITCIGSDGIKRRQLVKGKDDLRQDAVMQQVFSLVNRLLQRNQETRKRRLQIRTYKIVPLSQRSGLLEWCEGTMPIGEYLIGDQKTKFGAHKRYRPQDCSSMECRRKMQVAHNSAEKGKKDREYLSIMKKFQPVFRHFFLEKFPDPAVWLERRLAYTRSVAASSIVGYVVGLGDRHVQNILIDCNQAELVHIDLGVAFEQGRILPTPETVPFRLTRDLVDGMGIAGVEGVFRRCCEKTMDVMHNSQEALLTIIQVLLYDPLYIWTMSPHKAMALQQRRDRTDPDASEFNTTATDLPDGEAGLRGQDNDGSEVNKVAERVVLRLRQKLQGVEEGVAMSVKGQVNRLIQEARDPKNLCRLFPGWQPWI